VTDPHPARPTRRALVAYAAAWIVTGAVTAAVLILALRGCADDQLPPLKRADLADAARDGRCRLARVTDRRPGNPPAAGNPAGEPARAGVYDETLPDGPLVRAVRRGIIVVQYRPPIDDAHLDQLRLIHAAVPKATIVAPNGTRMPFALAALGWRRLLGCARVSAASLEAVRLFRARNVGRGPDEGP
jgi:hypothetical protein